MSTPNSRRPAHEHPRTPTTPNSTASTPVEPKSDYLRFALQAKRAQHATPQITTPVTDGPLRSAPLRKAGSDPWLDQAMSEDDAPQTTPIRQSRRPSDGGIPRMRTQRELQVETEKMKEALFSLNMKLELVRKQNNDLKDQVEVAQLRIEELEPLEDENHELQDENQRLTLKLQNVSEEAVQLRDHNLAILKIQDESVANMEKQNAALEEATEIIIRLEGEKSTLALENSQLKDQLLESQSSGTVSSGTYHTAVEGNSNRYPSRVYSIDESRPSTSHFDSDYYSQPASPHVKRSKDSLADVELSDRARNFLSMKKDGHKSVQDLKKRISDASLRGVRPADSAVPEVPPIPKSFQEQPQRPAKRTPRRSKPLNHLSPATIAQSESGRSTNPSPRTPTTAPGDGLRGRYRERLTLDTSTRDTQASLSYNNSPVSTRSFKPSRSSDAPTPPDRYSSKRASHQSSQSQLHELAKEQLQSDTQVGAEEGPSEWASIPPPPSIISDLTTELGDPREKWWRDVNKLQHSNSNGKVGAAGGFAHSLTMAGARAAPNKNNLGSPYMETDFFFNGSESEDQFMQRAHSYVKRR
jgi:hypothetical protein